MDDDRPCLVQQGFILLNLYSKLLLFVYRLFDYSMRQKLTIFKMPLYLKLYECFFLSNVKVK